MSFVRQFEKRAKAAGYKLTSQRLALVKELAHTTDHPTAETLLVRLRRKEPRYNMASLYRTLNILEKLDLIARHDFGGGKARIEIRDGEHHNHLIDVESGDIVEFTGKRIEALQHEMAEKLGYELIDYKLAIYARPKGSTAGRDAADRVLAKRKQAPHVLRA